MAAGRVSCGDRAVSTSKEFRPCRLRLVLSWRNRGRQRVLHGRVPNRSGRIVSVASSLAAAAKILHECKPGHHDLNGVLGA
jgi:hypothetical protein